MHVNTQRESGASDRIEWIFGGAGNVDDDLIAQWQQRTDGGHNWAAQVVPVPNDSKPADFQRPH
jgi:hypothetical protein